MFICKYNCGTEFTTRQNKWRHETKSCPFIKEECNKDKTTNELELKIKELELKIRELEITNKELVNRCDKIKDDYIMQLKQSTNDVATIAYNTSTVAQTTSTTAKKAIGALKYIKQQLTPPALPTFRKDEIVGVLELERTDKHTPCEFLIYKYKNNQLDSFLGDMIVKIYKGESIEEQQIWSTDPSRFTCVISELVDDTKAQWITDTGGVKIINEVIKPMFKIISEMMTKYINEIGKVNHYKVPDCKMNIMTEYTQYAAQLKNDIQHNKFTNSIMRIITTNLDFKSFSHVLENYNKDDVKEKKLKKHIKLEIADMMKKPMSSYTQYIDNYDECDSYNEMNENKKSKKYKIKLKKQTKN